MRGSELIGGTASHIILSQIVLRHHYCFKLINVLYLHIFLGSTSIKRYAACIREAKWPFPYLFVGSPLIPWSMGKTVIRCPEYRYNSCCLYHFILFIYLLFERTVLYYASIQLVYRRHRYRITQAQSLAGLSRQNDSLSSAASTQYFRSEFNRGVGPCHQDHF